MAITTTANNTHRRERLAWAILIGSFFVCLLITVTVPLAASAFVQSATIDLGTTVQANQGTVGIDDAGGVRSAALVGEQPQSIEAGSSILTDASAACGTQVITIGRRYAKPRRVRRGVGVAAAMLLRAGIAVVSHRDRLTLTRLGARVDGRAVPDDLHDHHDSAWVRAHLPDVESVAEVD